MKKIWDKAELLAIEYLKRNDYIIITTNFKFSLFWEIDIIAKKDNITIFIEVKYRKNTNYGTPEESITPTKLKKIHKTIDYFCALHCISPENIRFDIITLLAQEKNIRLTHYKNQALWKH